MIITVIEGILLIGALSVWMNLRKEKKEQIDEKKNDLCMRNLGELNRDYLKILVEYTLLMQYSGIINYEIISGQYLTKREINVRLFFMNGETKIISLFTDNLLCPKGKIRKDILGVNENDVNKQTDVDVVTEWIIKKIPVINELVQEKIKCGDGVYLYYPIEDSFINYINEINLELNKKTPYSITHKENILEINFQCLIEHN